MNRTEYIGKLNALYVGDKNCLEELITAYDEKDKENRRLYIALRNREQEIERLNKALLDIKEYIETFEEITGITNRYDYRVKEKLLDIVNKALGSDKE